jgi:hypothetical protein
VARKTKIGDPRGVRDWEALETVGDTKRFLRWAVLSMRNQTLDRQDAAVFCQIANTLLRAIEGNDLEQRIRTLEASLEKPTATH